MASSKMCCVFCKAMGKPETEWNTHWVKDQLGPDAKVVCPALLSNECGYCHATGHTPKFCPVLAAKKERQAKRKAFHAKKADGGRQLGAWIKPEVGAVRHRNASWTKAKHVFRPAGGGAKVATKVVKGPSPVVPMPPQGVWNSVHKAELDGLKSELEAMKVRLAAAEQTKALKAYLTGKSVVDFVGKQTLEETAAGEAFFDNDADVEEAVEAIASTEQPALERQGAFGIVQSVAVPLPENCNLDEDFGTSSTTDWGDDPDGINVVCE